jgi:DNA (cytosine-5)-methyltransferase 1
MKHGSLFSGIGGFDLAAEWMDWENVFHCEWNEFGQKVLKYYWQEAISYADITKTDFNVHRGQIDILTGGFPCQPYSVAGKRKGTEDSRHLWPEMLRAIREIQPTYIVGENVSGLINWNGGLVFDQVQIDLEVEGYEVQPVVFPAAGVNAPHRRDRVWFIAYSDSNGHKPGGLREGGFKEIQSESKGYQRQRIWNNAWGISETELITYTESSSSEGEHKQRQGERKLRGFNSKDDATNSDSGRQPGKEYRKEESGQFTGESISNYWQNFPTQSPICNGDDGLSQRLDTITFPKWRNESIKAGGNAIVPQVAFEIFKAIKEIEGNRSTGI